jgi:uncharacterized protein YjbJ (UPF0337 family)
VDLCLSKQKIGHDLFERFRFAPAFTQRGPTLALINQLGTAHFGRPASVGGCVLISQSGLEIETKGKMEETEGRFRGDLGKVAGDTSEHVKDRVEEAKEKIQKDFGKTERKV